MRCASPYLLCCGLTLVAVFFADARIITHEGGVLSKIQAFVMQQLHSQDLCCLVYMSAERNAYHQPFRACSYPLRMYVGHVALKD